MCEALHWRHDAHVPVESLGSLLPLSGRLGRLLRASHHFGLEVKILIEDHFELVEGAVVGALGPLDLKLILVQLVGELRELTIDFSFPLQIFFLQVLHSAVELRDVVFLVLEVLLGLQQFGLQFPRLLLDLCCKVLLRIQNLLVKLVD